MPPLVLVCPRCGSRERRANQKGCAACHRMASLAQRRAGREHRLGPDVRITPAVRAYLRAFDALLRARRDGNSREERVARVVMIAALERLEGKGR